MVFQFKFTFEINAIFEHTIPLLELEKNKKLFNQSGVYIIHEKSTEIQTFTPYLKTVVYIGKAIQETIYTRCRKHLCTLGLSKAKTKTRPGKKFREYRDSLSDQPKELLLTAAFLDINHYYLISCLEEYLIHSYEKIHHNKPPANTK